jgi:solute carrier family 31 (copper transporter), member 1
MIDISGFISRTWRITSKGMFAGSCIGVILLVCSLEFLRRLGKEYDRYLVRQFERQAYQRTPSEMSDEPSDRAAAGPGGAKGFTTSASRRTTHKRTFKPNVLQQFTRALLHMLQFGVAYFIMLLAMYYNGYIIICILIGALLGSLVFNWETLGGAYG